MIVEDTHIDALGTQPGIEAGPTAAIEEFLDSEPGKDFERDLTREAFVLTFTPRGMAATAFQLTVRRLNLSVFQSPVAALASLRRPLRAMYRS